MTFLTDRFGVTSEHNSTTVTLVGDATFTGTADLVENYGDVTISLKSDVNSAVGGVLLQFSQNGTNWDISETHSYIASNSAVILTNVKGKYFRLVYTNGSVSQSIFRLQTIFAQVKLGAGSTTNGNTSVTFDDTHLDAFGRMKVANPNTLLDVTHTKGKNELLVHELTFAGATGIHDENSSSVLMSVSSNGDRIIRQSRRYTVYQPGKSLLIILTGVIDAGTNGSDTVSRIGYYDDNDGIFFEYDGTGLFIVKRQNGSDTRIAQNNWNNDKANGSGNSGLNIDPSKTQIFVIDIEWLGVGRVRTGIYYNGALIVLHSFYHSNIETNTYMKNANLPVRYELTAVGAGNPSGSLRSICSSVISDGGYNPVGKTFTANMGSTTKTASSGTPLPLIAIRLKDQSAPGGEMRTSIVLRQFSVSSTNTTGKISLASIYLFQDIGDSFLTSPSWTSVHNQSAVEYDISATAGDLTNGIPIQSLYFGNRIEIFSSSLDSLVPVTTNAASTFGGTGVSDILVIFVEPENANADYLASMTWEEVF